MNQIDSPHPLGPLAALASHAQEWQSRDRGLGGTWAGLWHPEQQQDILASVAAHAECIDDIARSHLARQGALPGVRDYRPLWALLPISRVDPDPNESIEEAATEESTTEESPAPIGLPIWHHGIFEQARLTTSQHAIHIMRYLDDYHEPSLAAMRRYRLRRLANPTSQEQAAACQEVAEAFLEKPTRWRDVVETAVYLASVRACEQHLGQQIKAPGRTTEQLRARLDIGIGALVLGGAAGIANTILEQLDRQLAQLTRSKVVLMYEEHTYLHLSGIQAGRSVRRHLARGLHLIFSSQDHRRADRTVDAWLTQSDADHQAGPYHFASAIPPDYAAARAQRESFRLTDPDAMRRYLSKPPGAEST